jgi:benzoyl-CoA reductase/2-hydroxyglutaryl-CoA dehydratase subunit BcrC/BadD/HgdB
MGNSIERQMKSEVLKIGITEMKLDRRYENLTEILQRQFGFMVKHNVCTKAELEKKFSEEPFGGTGEDMFEMNSKMKKVCLDAISRLA